MDDASDADLLRRHAAGDAQAFPRLYDRHDRKSFDYIRRCLHPADVSTAEDLHQDVWLAVARAAGHYDAARASFVTWLFTIARNRVLDWQRQHAGRVHDALDAAAELPGAPREQPPQRLQAGRLAEAVVQAVEALPPAQRETFVLFSFDELSLEEIAGLTHVPVETAKTRLRYARDVLRARLQAWRMVDV
jgi:RNA polymerase sigma factor (sigma-70 family)